MSVKRFDGVFYGSASMPDGDGATTGGAAAFNKRLFFSDLLAAGTVNYVSSSASDTAVQITTSGRDNAGVIQTEAKTLGGQTPVAGGQTFERLMKAVVTSGTAAGDAAVISNTKVLTGRTATGGGQASGTDAAYIDLASGDGASVAAGQIVRILNNTPAGVQYQLRMIIELSGDRAFVNRDWGTAPTSSSTYDVHTGMLLDLAPNQVTEVRRPFYDAASDTAGGSSRTYYEKVFAINNNTVTSLTGAAIKKLTDPSAGVLDFALTNALNDTATVANRQTLPATGITAFSSGAAPQSIAVPSPANLPAGNAPNAAGAQGVWLRLTLAAGLAPTKTSEQMSITGNSV